MKCFLLVFLHNRSEWEITFLMYINKVVYTRHTNILVTRYSTPISHALFNRDHFMIFITKRQFHKEKGKKRKSKRDHFCKATSKPNIASSNYDFKIFWLLFLIFFIFLPIHSRNHMMLKYFIEPKWFRMWFI